MGFNLLTSTLAQFIECGAKDDRSKMARGHLIISLWDESDEGLLLLLQ